MLKNIISEWKASPLGITLLMTGYIIGILVLSIGVSIVYEANENYLDSFSGNPKDNLVLNLSAQNPSDFSYKNVLPIISRHYLNLQGNYDEENSIPEDFNIFRKCYSEIIEYGDNFYIRYNNYKFADCC